MDDVRDIQKGSTFSRFLDQPVRTNPFGENRSGERAYRRAERIAAALYLLTNHMAPGDTLRERVRRAASDLLPALLALRDDMRSGGSAKSREFEALIRHLISLVRLLVFSGFVSFQNAEVVAEALDDLGNFLVASQRSSLSESVKLSREQLIDVRDVTPQKIKDIKDSTGVKDKRGMSVMPASHNVSARGTSILQILRTGGELGIRDIVANFPEYSEKTVQRELTALVRNGQVKKIGLKRWSKYSALEGQK